MDSSKAIAPISPNKIYESLASFGSAISCLVQAVSVPAFRNLRWADIRRECVWMGLGSFETVAIPAILIASALTLQTVRELHTASAQDGSGAMIAVGLLRELGPLTISLAWCARIAARLSSEARDTIDSLDQVAFSESFVLPRFIAALTMSVPLSAYGLVIGFVTGALVAPIVGASSTSDFFETARLAIKDRDLACFFIKLILVNPTIAVLAGCCIGRRASLDSHEVAAKAVTATFICGYAANLVLSILLYGNSS